MRSSRSGRSARAQQPPHPTTPSSTRFTGPGSGTRSRTTGSRGKVPGQACGAAQSGNGNPIVLFPNAIRDEIERVAEVAFDRARGLLER